MNAKRILTGLVLATVVALPFALSAASASQTFTVSASVSANCTISTEAVAFGAYDPVSVNASTPKTGAGSVTIACTKGTVPTIALNFGANASGSTRRMASGGDLLTYELWADASYSTAWTSGSGALSPGVATSKDPRKFDVYGRIPAGQDVPAGSYADTITATVNY